MSDRIVYKISQEFKSQLDSLLDELLQTRKKAIDEIVEAKKNGDLSENADYDAARDLQSRTEDAIYEVQNILDNYEIVKPKTYTYVTDEGEEMSLTLVDTKEATLYRLSEGEPRRISIESAVGQALDGTTVGEEVDVTDEDDEILYSLTVKDIR